MEQPGAKDGDKTYCLMSGVVITAGDEHKPFRLLDGAKVYFCCEACAKHFDENTEKVRIARGL